MDCYPSNTAAQYTTKLPHPLSLEGDREVALTEISVPDIFHNVKKDSRFLTLTKDYSHSVENGNWIEYHPLTSVGDDSPIEFEINGNGEDYCNH